MNYNAQKLKSYLLGEFSAADAEAFDELNFTDEKFSADLSAAENDLIDAYVNDELDKNTREKFEKIYFAAKHRREKMEFARALQTFGGKENLNSKVETGKTGFFAAWNIFQNRALQIGFAAAMLVLFFGIFWFAFLREKNASNEIAMQTTPTPKLISPANENTNNENIPAADGNQTNVNSENANEKTNQKSSNANKKFVEPDQTSNKENSSQKNEYNPPRPIIATFLLAPPLRGAASKIPLFGVPKNASQISVELQLEANDFENYHVTLTNETGDINLWRRSPLKAKSKGADKVLNVNFPAKLLRNGFYSLTVSGISDNGEAEIVANYPFRVNEK